LANFQGLVGPTGAKVTSYYAFRMGIRALNGCRTAYQSPASDSNLLAITTKDAAGQLSLLVTNSASRTSYTVTADLSALSPSGPGTMRRFDAVHADVAVAPPTLNNGQVRFTIPATAAVLLTF
jgi:hypothetical protein